MAEHSALRASLESQLKVFDRKLDEIRRRELPKALGSTLTLTERLVGSLDGELPSDANVGYSIGVMIVV